MDESKIHNTHNVLFSDTNLAYAKKISKITGCGQAYSELCVEWAHQKLRDNHATFAMELLEQAQRAHHIFGAISKFEYISEVYDIPRKMAKLYQSDSIIKASSNHRNRIKIVYILRNLQETAVAKSTLLYIKNHDKKKFHIKIALSQKTEPLHERDIISLIEENSITVFGLKESEKSDRHIDRVQFCEHVVGQINNFSPDIIITSVVGPFEAFICYAINPVPIVHLIFGDQWGFILPTTQNQKIIFVNGVKHQDPLITYIKPLVLPPAFDLMETTSIQQKEKKKFKIVISGRPQKFSSQEYWTMILDLLSSRNDISLSIIGTTLDAVLPWVGNINLSNPNIKFIPRLPRVDFFLKLQKADLVLDTYPEGGGLSIVEALHLNKVVITFQTPPKAKKFYEINPANDWIPKEFTLPQNDSQQLIYIIGRLIDDEKFKAKAEALIKTSADRLFENAHENMRMYETFLLKL